MCGGGRQTLLATIKTFPPVPAATEVRLLSLDPGAVSIASINKACFNVVSLASRPQPAWPHHASPSKAPDPALPIQSSPVYQLAFCTPGRAPAKACIRKLYCQHTPRLAKYPLFAHEHTIFPLASAPLAPAPRPHTHTHTHRGSGRDRERPYPRHLKVPENTPSFSS